MYTFSRFPRLPMLVGAHLEKPCSGVPSHESNIRGDWWAEAGLPWKRVKEKPRNYCHTGEPGSGVAFILGDATSVQIQLCLSIPRQRVNE